jgi:hypothetical protein
MEERKPRRCGELPFTYGVGWLRRAVLVIERLGEDVGHGCFRRSDHMGVDAKRDRWVGMAQPGRHYVDGDADQGTFSRSLPM